jgi:23S rRNA (guanine745-N1)-methyltransferase
MISSKLRVTCTKISFVLSADLIDALRCPLCARPLAPASQSLRCAAGHSFDVAKQGYAFLGTGKQLPEGDSAPMVQARAAFLSQGHFAPIAETVAAQTAQHTSDGLIVDLGAGPGYYLATVLSGLPHARGLAFDVSKPALKRAAKAHPRLGAVLADTWGSLPLASACAAVVLNVFAPRHGEEMRRILQPGGALIVVTPEPDHLIELRTELGLLSVDESKADRVAASLAHFDLAISTPVRWSIRLDQESAAQLVLMGPNARHTPKLPEHGLTVTASVTVATWTGRPLPSPADHRDAAH